MPFSYSKIYNVLQKKYLCLLHLPFTFCVHKLKCDISVSDDVAINLILL